MKVGPKHAGQGTLPAGRGKEGKKRKTRREPRAEAKTIVTRRAVVARRTMTAGVCRCLIIRARYSGCSLKCSLTYRGAGRA